MHSIIRLTGKKKNNPSKGNVPLVANHHDRYVCVCVWVKFYVENANALFQIQQHNEFKCISLNSILSTLDKIYTCWTT